MPERFRLSVRGIGILALLAGTLGLARGSTAVLAGAAGIQATPAQEKRYTVPELVKTMSPAVVFIGNVDKNGDVTSIGSGFVVDASGLIVTNFHVIEGAQDARVKMKDGEIYDRVEIIDYDQRRDLALLKIRAFKPLPTLTLGDSSTIEVGEEAVAIGNPQGLEHTVSLGVISAFRQGEGFRMIQISVPISPGSSGGPLFDLKGRVIGITSAGVVGEGAQNLNFAIPAEYVKPLVASKSTPMSLAQFTQKMGGSTPASKPSGATSRGGETKGVWAVAHDHEGGSFKDFCIGRLYLTSEVIGFTTDSGRHAWEMPLSAVKEAAKNVVYGSEYQAFHIRLVTNTNYNFVAIDDQLNFRSPDMILFQIIAGLQRIK